MENCGLCGTEINQEAIVCTGCGAVKTKLMPKGECVFWWVIIGGLFVMAGMGYNTVAFILPAGAFIAFLFRYMTRQEYWVRKR